jgi:hypothetical protein
MTHPYGMTRDDPKDFLGLKPYMCPFCGCHLKTHDIEWMVWKGEDVAMIRCSRKDFEYKIVARGMLTKEEIIELKWNKEP